MFSVVSVHGEEGAVPHVTITHDALDLTIQGPTPSSGMSKLVHYEACKVGKRAVLILLVCFLIQKDFVKWVLSDKIAMIIPFLVSFRRAGP